MTPSSLGGWNRYVHHHDNIIIIIIMILSSSLLYHHYMTVKQVSSEKVVYVFSMRAHRLGLKEINCVSEELYEEALQTAREGSATSTTTKSRRSSSLRSQSVTPRLLEGVPVSIKECIQVQGCDSTCGLAVRTFNPCKVSTS